MPEKDPNHGPEQQPNPEPYSNGTEVFLSIGDGIAIGKVIAGKYLEKDLELPSTDEGIPSTIIPKGTPFNTIEIIQAQEIETGTTLTYISSMLKPLPKPEDR